MPKLPSTIDELLAQCRASVADCDRARTRLATFAASMPPLRHKPAPFIPVPAPPPPPDYFLSERDREAVLATEKMLALAKLMRGRSEHAYFRAAGQYLARLRNTAGGRDQAEFAAILDCELGLSLRRAYELIELAAVPAADAKQAFSEFSRAKADRVRKARQIKQNSGDNPPDRSPATGEKD